MLIMLIIALGLAFQRQVFALGKKRRGGGAEEKGANECCQQKGLGPLTIRPRPALSLD